MSWSGYCLRIFLASTSPIRSLASYTGTPSITWRCSGGGGGGGVVEEKEKEGVEVDEVEDEVDNV